MFLRLVNAKKARVRSGKIQNYFISLGTWAVYTRVYISFHLSRSKHLGKQIWTKNWVSKFISISKFVLVVGGLASWWWFAAQPFVLANDFRRNLKRGVMALPTQSFKEYCTDYWSKLKMQIAANTYFWVDKYDFSKSKKSTWDRNPPAVSCNVSFHEEQAVFGREEGDAVLASEGPCQQGALLLLPLLEEGHQV